MDKPLDLNAQKNKSAMVKSKLHSLKKQLHYSVNTTYNNICTESMLTQSQPRAQSDVKAELYADPNPAARA